MYLLTLNWNARAFKVWYDRNVIHCGTMTKCVAEVSTPVITARDYVDGRLVTLTTQGNPRGSLTITIERNLRAPADTALDWLLMFCETREPNLEIEVMACAAYPSGLHVSTQTTCTPRPEDGCEAWSFKFERLYVFKVSPPG